MEQQQGTIRSRREAKIYAAAVIAGFIMVPVLVICTFATGSWLFLLLAVIIGIVTARYSKHLTTYTRNQKETS